MSRTCHFLVRYSGIMNRTFKVILTVYACAAIGLLVWGAFLLTTEPNTRSLSYQAKLFVSAFGPQTTPRHSRPKATKPWIPREKHVDDAVAASVGGLFIWGLALLFLKLGFIPLKYGVRIHRNDKPIKFNFYISLLFLMGAGFLVWAAKNYHNASLLPEGSWLEKWTRWPILANGIALAVAGEEGVRIGSFMAFLLSRYFSEPATASFVAPHPSWRWQVPCIVVCALLYFLLIRFLLLGLVGESPPL